jgi:hypothetical protein
MPPFFNKCIVTSAAGTCNLALPNAVELKPLNPMLNGLLPSLGDLLITKENLHLLKEESALLKE